MFRKLIIFCALACVMGAANANSKLYVFVPTEARANVMQESISQSCSNVDVTVFGRARDFSNQLKKAPPAAVLTLLPVIERNTGLQTVLKGSKGGATVEDYVLVTLEKAVDLNQLSGKKVGVVDVLGRKPMAEFVGQLLQADVKLKRVSKIEDLLPLLSFGAVDSVFIPESIYERIRAKSKQELVATRLNVKVGLASAAMSTSQPEQSIVECIANLPARINSEMGVDQWKQM